MSGIGGLFGADWEQRQIDTYLERRGPEDNNGNAQADHLHLPAKVTCWHQPAAVSPEREPRIDPHMPSTRTLNRPGQHTASREPGAVHSYNRTYAVGRR